MKSTSDEFEHGEPKKRRGKVRWGPGACGLEMRCPANESKPRDERGLEELHKHELHAESKKMQLGKSKTGFISRGTGVQS